MRARLLSPRLRPRLVLLFGGLALGLLLVEGAALLMGGRERPQYEIEQGEASRYFSSDPELGYGPPASSRVHARLVRDGRPIYDVHYTIDERRHRLTKGDPGGETFLFFGCSFTFGEGLEDDETLPWAFSEATGFRDNVVNLGFQGYGAHQMLRALETGRADDLIGAGVERVFYSAIYGHVRRAMGNSPWDLYGPRYEIVDDQLRYEGPFHSSLMGLAITAGNRLNVFDRLRDRWLWREPESEQDRERYLAIVARSAEIVRERWGAGFTVVYWDYAGDPLPDRLEEMGIDVVRVSEILPRGEWGRHLLPIDKHPAPSANGAIGRYLAEKYAG